MKSEEKNKLKKCDKKKIYNQEEIEEIKESYKLGIEYYKDVEKKIEN